MAHERYNADWVVAQGVGVAVRDFATELGDAVKTMLLTENYARYRTRVAGMSNSAVYEIPHLLEGILTSLPQSIPGESDMRFPWQSPR